MKVAGLLLILALVPTAGAGTTGASIIVSPSSALLDQSVDVRVTGLSARAKTTLQAETRDSAGRLWRSRMMLEANAKGVIDTRSSMQLFWSMSPADGRRVSSSSFVPPRSGRVSLTAFRAGRIVARGSFLRTSVAPGVVVRDYNVADFGFAGTYSSIPTQERHAAVLTIGGSAGGHSHGPSLTASHGYPTLSLGYFGEPGLPATLQNIPLEYFQNALHWLSGQPGVDPNRIAVLGISRGGELAILLAATYPDLIRGAWACTTGRKVLGGNPSGAAWTLNGRAVPFGDLPVTKISGPVVVTGGGKDEIIDSAFAAADLAATARANGQTNVTSLVYPAAGHGVGCRLPNIPLPSDFQVGSNTVSEVGGTPAANESAAGKTWPLFLDWLQRL